MGSAAMPIAMGTTVLGTGISAYGQLQAGAAASDYYKSLARTSNINAGLAEMTGEANAKAIGAQAGFEVAGLIRKKDETVGAQKAALAGNGVYGGRTQQDIVKDTLMKSEMDIEALNLNANLAAKNARMTGKLAAFNYRNDAMANMMGARNARTAAGYGAVTSILGGASSVAQNWYTYKKG